MAAAHRQPAEADVLRQKNAFVAEAAADIRRDDAHLSLHQPQTFREAGAHDMRHLVAGVQNELVHAAVPIGDRAAAFDRSHALAGGGNLARDLDRRVERGLDIDVDERLKERVVAPVLVQERRVRQARRKHVVHGRQLLEIDLDARGDILSLGTCPADAHRDEFADLPHLLVASTGCSDALNPGRPDTATIGFTPTRSAAANALPRCSSGMWTARSFAWASG